MSKVRIYELAKELGIESKDLIKRLKELGIDAKSHSSSIDDIEAVKAREVILGGKRIDVVEKRIKPTVIRRRAVLEPTEEAPKIKVEEVKPEIIESVKEMAQEEIPETKEVKEEVKIPHPEFKEVAREGEAREVKKVEAGIEVAVEQKLPPIPLVSKYEKPKEEKEEKVEEKVTPTRKGDKDIFEEKKPLKRKLVSRRREDYILSDSDEVAIETTSLFVPLQKRKKKKIGIPKKTEITIPKAIKRIVKIVDNISPGELAKRMGVKSSDIIKKLMNMGVLAGINQSVDYETASIIAHDYNYEVQNVAFVEEELLETQSVQEEEVKPRPPVVTIMGHVDHGKTSLLDAIRQTNVIAGEAGGITQHIGAYSAKLDKGTITFLDTPGHEAFTAMRARGAKITDIVVLVVAADDGVMLQTVEAIDHAKAANVPIIVAINKIDKQDANPEMVKKRISEYGLVPEAWGGDTIFAEVSAKKKIGIEELLELILLQAEVMELKAQPNKLARGTIVEAKLDKGRGAVATVLVQDGTLKEGDFVVCGVLYGRVRAMYDDKGKKISQVLPAFPAEVIGLSSVPEAGEKLHVVSDERIAKQLSEHRLLKQKESKIVGHGKITLEDLYQRIQKQDIKELKIVLKGDVHGSVEAVRDALLKLGVDVIKVNVIHGSVGSITENDVLLASASDAVIIGFGVRPETKAKELAEIEGVEIKLYNIIYDVIIDVKKAMEGMLEPTIKEVFLGRADVRQIFNIHKLGNVAGCFINEGKILRSGQVRIIRDKKVIHEGKISSLKRFKDDVKEVQSGFDCGILIDNFNKFQVGDIIECFEYEKIAGKLEN